MSYRKRENRHDEWERLLRDAAAVVAETGLPGEVFATEDAFTTFLTTGVTTDGSADLRAMTDERFLRVEDAARRFVPDFGVHQGSAAAFASEGLRRFGRYG